jgi:hypothetical protein
MQLELDELSDELTVVPWPWVLLMLALALALVGLETSTGAQSRGEQGTELAKMRRSGHAYSGGPQSPVGPVNVYQLRQGPKRSDVHFGP